MNTCGYLNIIFLFLLQVMDTREIREAVDAEVGETMTGVIGGESIVGEDTEL